MYDVQIRVIVPITVQIIALELFAERSRGRPAPSDPRKRRRYTTVVDDPPAIREMYRVSHFIVEIIESDSRFYR